MKIYSFNIRSIRFMMIMMTVIAFIGLGILIYPCFRNEALMPINQHISYPKDTQIQTVPKVSPPIPD